VQFSRYLTYSKSSSSFRWTGWILKGALIAASFYYVVDKTVAEQFVLEEIALLLNTKTFALVFALLMLLMGLNWMVEAQKWQILARGVQRISFASALKAILAGVSMDAVLPFGTGAVSSKLLSLESDGKKQLLAPVIIAQGIQSFWTIAFGFVGVSQLASYTNVFSIYGDLHTVIFVSLIGIIVFIVWWIFWPETRKYLLHSIKSISLRIWGVITLLSLVRYIIFFVQLMVISVYLAPEIPIFVLTGCITWMFFAKTIIPKPGHLGALGIRGASVVFFLNLAGYTASEVVLATLILWFINLAIPSLLGLYYIKNLTFKNAIIND